MNKVIKFSSEVKSVIPADSADYYNRQYFDDPIISTSLYGGGYSDHETFKKYADLLVKSLPPKVSILEIGAAKGFFVRRLREVEFEAQGCDISEYAISQAPAEIRPFLFRANVCDLPFQNDEFDYLVSIDTLEHVHPDKIDSAIFEIKRVSKERLILAIATYDDPNGREIIPIEERPLPDHLINANRNWWTKKFQGFGLLPDEELQDKISNSEVAKENNWKIWVLKKF